MKIFLRLFRYVLRYKQYLFLSIVLGFITSALNIFNIFAFQPVLEIMFTSEAQIKAKAVARESGEKEEEKKVKLPIVRTIEKKIKPYRDAIDRRMDELTQWALQNKMKAIYLIAIIVGISALFKSITAYGSDLLMIYMGLSLIRDIRQEVHDHILKMDLTFFAKRTTGQLLSRSSNDVGALNSSIISLMDVGIQSPLTIILTLLLMYYLSPQLTVYAFFLVPLATIFIAIFGRRIRKISKQAQKRIAAVLDVMQETYNAIRVVKAFGMEEFESSRFRTVNEKANKSYLRRQAVKKIISPLMEFLGVMAAVLVLMAGAHLIIREQILTGTKFFIFLFAASRLYRPIKELSKIHLEIQSGLAGAERVFEILDTRQNLTEKPDAPDLPPVKDKISFDHVSFHYENSSYHALENITVDIRRGSVVALVGRSGAGKTTFANLLCRFYDPTDGAITVDGKDIRDVSLQSLRDRIAIVTQETILFNDTIRNNIAYGRKDIPIESIIDAAEKSYADEFIRNLPEGYDTPIGQHGGRLSGGQRQRIAIARAILKNPDILVFDEATSSLDSEAEHKIQQAMQNLIKGRTTLIIAHRLSTVKMADDILVLDGGKLIEQGPPEELLKQNGEYAKLCHLQGIFIDAENTGAST